MIPEQAHASWSGSPSSRSSERGGCRLLAIITARTTSTEEGFMIDLYLSGTANGLRASVALEECALPYRAHAVDLAKGEQRSAEFMKLNPAGLVPVLVDSEGPDAKPLIVSQSGAIVLYAAEKSGR